MKLPSVSVLLLICVAVLSGCATLVPPANVPVEVKAAELPPPPANVMVPREANFLDNLLNFLSQKPAAPMK